MWINKDTKAIGLVLKLVHQKQLFESFLTGVQALQMMQLMLRDWLK